MKNFFLKILLLMMTVSLFFEVKSYCDQDEPGTISIETLEDVKTKGPELQKITATIGLISFLIHEVVAGRLQTLDKTFEKQTTVKGFYDDFQRIWSVLGMTCFDVSYFLNNCASAMLEKDSSFFLRLCRHFGLSLDGKLITSPSDSVVFKEVGSFVFRDSNACLTGKKVATEIGLMVTEEIMRAFLYKGVSCLGTGKENRIMRRVLRVLGKSSLLAGLRFIGDRINGKKDWGPLFQIFIFLIYYTACEYLAEDILLKVERNELRSKGIA